MSPRRTPDRTRPENRFVAIQLGSVATKEQLVAEARLTFRFRSTSAKEERRPTYAAGLLEVVRPTASRNVGCSRLDRSVAGCEDLISEERLAVL